MIIKRFFAYAFDVYFITVVQLLLFNFYRYFSTGVSSLSMVYILENFRNYFVAISIFYFLATEFLFNKTLGKKIFKLEVIFTDKTFLSALIRSIIRLFPFDIFFILIFKDRFLHDYLSKTYVVDRSKLEDNK
ncbi:RDD family protein [Epilithonimonas sp. JDS]|uniref:RDD family protein n=1 Tax=Epilithonimonas sp. JDS TaxID=2902797 RepID=UPI001E3031CE|nr:RDD family protein [Epilithonimonas sp. JDS]